MGLLPLRTLLAFLIVGCGCCLWCGALQLCAVEPDASNWVRTVDGWETTKGWFDRPRLPPALHPFVVAAAQLMGSLFSLLAFSPRRQPRDPQP